MLFQLGAPHFMAGQAVLPAVQSDTKSLQAFANNSSLKNMSFTILLYSMQELPLEIVLQPCACRKASKHLH